MEEAIEPAAEESPEELDPIAERVIWAISRSQGLRSSEVRLEQTFEELGFDSLDGLNVVFAVEEEFDIDVPDEVAQEFTSVGQVVEALRQLVAEGTGEAPA